MKSKKKLMRDKVLIHDYDCTDGCYCGLRTEMNTYIKRLEGASMKGSRSKYRKYSIGEKYFAINILRELLTK